MTNEIARLEGELAAAEKEIVNLTNAVEVKLDLQDAPDGKTIFERLGKQNQRINALTSRAESAESRVADLLEVNAFQGRTMAGLVEALDGLDRAAQRVLLDIDDDGVAEKDDVAVAELRAAVARIKEQSKRPPKTTPTGSSGNVSAPSSLTPPTARSISRRSGPSGTRRGA